MTWKPSNEPIRYDRPRVAQIRPIETEIAGLGLPLIRQRKIRAILSALEVQIEDGGDSPEVNRLLLDALRAGVRHQVNERQAKAVLQATDTFEHAEARRWKQVKAGTLPPIELTIEEQIDDSIQEGYTLLEAGQRTAACDRWLEAWELVKRKATPEMRTTMDFDGVYLGVLPSIFNWSQDLQLELYNAGLDDPAYYAHRVRYAREFLAQFPGIDEHHYVSYRRAEAEALWQLGRQAEAEAAYQALVEELPDNAWGYIGWSDEYRLERERLPDYERAEAILLQATARPSLDDREYVLDRLVRLYDAWGQPEKGTPFVTELDGIRAQEKAQRQVKLVKPSQPLQQPAGPASPKRASKRKRSKRKRRGG